VYDYYTTKVITPTFIINRHSCL